MDSAMDLSLRNLPPTSPLQMVNPIMSPSPSPQKLPLTEASSGIQIVRPIPRPPWSIMWYQNLWSISPGQTKSKSESEFDGNSVCEKSDAVTLLRTNERSSFSVLNKLSSNTVNNVTHNINNSNSCNFPYASRQDEEHQHTLFQFANDKNYSSIPTSETMTLAASSSFYKSKVHSDSLVDFQRQRNIIGQDKKPRNDYSTDDENDSDNSENIVVTTSSYQTGIKRSSTIKSSSSCSLDKAGLTSPVSLSESHEQHHLAHQTNVILDVACCDGPVQFKRVSNPNFALTVEHNEVCPPPPVPESNEKTLAASHAAAAAQHHENYGNEETERSFFPLSTASEGGKRFLLANNNSTRVQTEGDEQNDANAAAASTTVTTHKSYLCIYCNQSFKSLFCYQKHKKRHLNPVSVDITTTTANSTSYRGGNGVGCHKKGNSSGGVSTSGGGGGGGGGGVGNVGCIPENAKAKTKDLNVQFFPCKKCGCKFPSYYFVHKHRKICH